MTGDAVGGSGLAAPELSVVIPAHNSASLIAESVARLADRLRGRAAQIIIVENASKDDTLARCQAIQQVWRDPTIELVVLQCAHGLGNAYRTGVLASSGQTVLLTADDLPFGFDDLDALDALTAQPDGLPPQVMIGSKAHPRSRVMRGWVRGLLTGCFGLARRAVLRMRTGDPQGTFIINGDLARRLMPYVHEPGFLFTTELAYLIERLGITPIEVPVTLDRQHHAHASRVRMRDAFLMAAGLLRLRRRHQNVVRRISADLAAR